MQHAAALVFTVERQAAGLADGVTPALAGPAVTGPAAHHVWVLFRRPAGVGKFADHDLDGYRGHIAGRSKHLSAWWRRNFRTCPQITVPAFKRDQQAVEYIPAGFIAPMFVARDLIGGHADTLGELRLREVASDADTAKPVGSVDPRPICGGGTHTIPALM